MLDAILEDDLNGNRPMTPLSYGGDYSLRFFETGKAVVIIHDTVFEAYSLHPNYAQRPAFVAVDAKFISPEGKAVRGVGSFPYDYETL